MNGTGIGIIVGALLAGLLGWGARGLVADHIEVPRVIEHQAEICRQVTERHAAEAVAAEQLRQFKIGEANWERFYRESQAAADDAQAKLDLMELEFERYAQDTRDTGRVCALDDAALAVIGVRKAPEPARAGGR